MNWLEELFEATVDWAIEACTDVYGIEAPWWLYGWRIAVHSNADHELAYYGGIA